NQKRKLLFFQYLLLQLLNSYNDYGRLFLSLIFLKFLLEMEMVLNQNKLMNYFSLEIFLFLKQPLIFHYPSIYQTIQILYLPNMLQMFYEIYQLYDPPLLW